MPTSDALGNRCDRKLRLHIRRLHHLAFDPYQTLRCTQQVFGPIGIQVDACTIQSASIPVKDISRFATVQGPFTWNATTPDRSEMYARYGVQDLASITVFLVSRLAPEVDGNGRRTAVNGAASSPAQRPAVYLGAFAGPWDLAHELGHLLLHPTYARLHESDANNVMFRSSRWSPTTPTFNPRQVEVIRQSALLLHA